jgi:ABC-type oligopeptide transport system ATPase subunit
MARIAQRLPLREYQAQILNLLLKMNARMGRTMFISHDLAVLKNTPRIRLRRAPA